MPPLRTPLADGAQVQVYGNVSVFEARGQYQLSVQILQPRGLGLLQAKFEALKRKLEAEGLFDAARKRALPKFPRRIGIITSPSGAAIRDILNVLKRRGPWLQILINPVRVQGVGAAQEIAVAIRELATPNKNWSSLDVIVVARGGGSIEDLWEFNEEIVARAIFDSAVPIVSAVGHEIDFTICDFVADLRAPTPSAAAELIVPDIVDLRRHVDNCVACARTRVVQPVARRATAARSCARDFAALSQAQDRQLQARSSAHCGSAPSAQSRPRTHDTPQSCCRSQSPFACLAVSDNRKRKTTFSARRRDFTRARARCHVAPRLQHYQRHQRQLDPDD